jgi:hypothetical protein
MATTFSSALAPSSTVDATDGAPRAGLFRRFFDALVESRQRTAEREIERFIERNGGVLTDRLERELGRNFGSPAGRE